MFQVWSTKLFNLYFVLLCYQLPNQFLTDVMDFIFFLQLLHKSTNVNSSTVTILEHMFTSQSWAQGCKFNINQLPQTKVTQVRLFTFPKCVVVETCQLQLDSLSLTLRRYHIFLLAYGLNMIPLSKLSPPEQTLSPLMNCMGTLLSMSSINQLLNQLSRLLIGQPTIPQILVTVVCQGFCPKIQFISML